MIADSNLNLIFIVVLYQHIDELFPYCGTFNLYHFITGTVSVLIWTFLNVYKYICKHLQRWFVCKFKLNKNGNKSL